MKKSKKILLSFMTGAMLFSVLPNVASAHSNPLSVDEGEKKEISNEIEQLLESRAAIMVSDGQVLHESQFTSKAAILRKKSKETKLHNLEMN